ncbi:MAG: class I SAM-dependent methyltransferase [Alphaproteobacteria bacterium]|nr:class I SAM-dependent methyltransferase [Alphaproteobacteria bacterium]
MEFKRLRTSLMLLFSLPCLASSESEEFSYSSFLPKSCSCEYSEAASNVFKKLAKSPKTEIQHDHGMMLPNRVYADYGWDFPPIAPVQKELLSFCASQPSRKRFMDVGAGKGSDTVGMLLTGKTHVTAYELQQAQFREMQGRVTTLFKEVSPDLSIDTVARFRSGDFLTVKFNEGFRGGYTGINLNKVAHFWDDAQLGNFVEKAAFLLEKGVGRLFITVVTPTPGDDYEKFVNKNGYGPIFFTRKDLLNDTWSGILGTPTLTVRKPKDHEKPGHMYQSVSQEGSKAYAITDRVMYYHTKASLTHALGDKFRIVKVLNLAPKDIHPDAFESMLSIVAERTEL